MTIDSEDIIIKMLENDGTFPGDPKAYSIWTYTNSWDKQTFAVFMHIQHEDIFTSPFVRNPVLLWTKAQGLTTEGMQLIGKTGRMLKGR